MAFTQGNALIVEKRKTTGEADADRLTLLDRTLGSPAFAKSPRVRELLLYLCQRALENPKAAISEQEIGVAVFGRKPGYDSSAETIVRVQVSQLRKKLQQHFNAEGAEEPVLIDLPKGSYTPVFQPRCEPEPPQEHAPAPRWRLIGAAALGVLLITAALAYFLRGPQSPLSTPALDRFYREAFIQGQPMQIVVSDANLMMLSDVVRRLITLNEYRHREYPRQILDQIPDPIVRAQTYHENGTYLIPIQDATVARDLTALGARYQIPTTITSARDFRMPQTGPANLVLLGHKKANPWMELFEDRMNFRYELTPAPELKGAIVNRSPKPGEPAIYGSEWVKSGHCVVAYLPKPVGQGAAVLVFGTDMSSLLAGGAVLTDEKQMSKLLALLNLRKGDRIPYFEALLRTRIVANAAPAFDFVTTRLIDAR